MTPEEKKKYKHEWYIKNKDKCNKRSKKWREDHQDKVKEYNNQYYIDHADEIKGKQLKVYEENKEEIRKKQKEYYDRTIDERRAASKRWADQHREHKRQKDREYYEKNKEKIKEYVSNFYKEHRELRNFFNSKYRACVKSSIPSWANLEAIKAIYEQCEEMNKNNDGVQYVVDHIIPLRGKNVCGLHVENNLQIIEMHENCRKSNKFDPELYPEQANQC